MNNLNNSLTSAIKHMLSPNAPELTMDEAAELLKDNPDMLKIFEDSYKRHLEEKESTQAPLTNSKEMTKRANKKQQEQIESEVDTERLNDTINGIVKDLVSLTPIFRFSGSLLDKDNVEYIDAEYSIDTITDSSDINFIKSLPISYRPQLTATKSVKDMPGVTGMLLLSEYKKAIDKRGTQEGLYAYHRFRQGLDILDIDDVSYYIITRNRNSMGHWLPKLIEASSNQYHFKIPKTTIVQLPIPLLQLTKLEYESINKTTRKILNTWVKRVFNLNVGDYFIKTGTYSYKFDFRNVRVRDLKEIEEIGEYLLYIHGYANQMAGPLYSPCIYGMSTTHEWVVRDFIESKEDVPTIYNGLPLHVEYRVFIDCDTKEVLSIHPYWDPEGMKKHFSKYAKGGNINHIHDYVVFKSHEDRMKQKFNREKDNIVKHLQPIVDKLDLTGQWSLDIMDDGESLWLIDMAVAEQSTFYESVPEDKRKPVLEQWIPGLDPVIPPWYNTNTIELATKRLEIENDKDNQKKIE